MSNNLGSVVIKCVEMHNPRLKVRGQNGPKKKLLPGASTTITPIPIGNGRINSGTTLEEYARLEGGFDLDTWKNEMSHVERQKIASEKKSDYDKFFSSFSLKLFPEDVKLNMSDPRDIYKYNLAKVCIRQVAKSKDDINPITHTHYIEDIERSSEEELSNFEEILQAGETWKKMAASERRDFLRLYGYRTDDSSQSVIDNTLRKELQKDPAKFLLLYNSKDKYYEILIAKGIQKGVFSRKNESIYYGSPDRTGLLMGIDLTNAIEFLKSPENNTLFKEVALKLNGQDDVRPVSQSNIADEKASKERIAVKRGRPAKK